MFLDISENLLEKWIHYGNKAWRDSANDQKGLTDEEIDKSVNKDDSSIK